MSRRTITVIAAGVLAVSMLSACSSNDDSATSTPSPTAATTTATPDTSEFIATLRSQGFEQAEAVLTSQGNATCVVLGQYDVQTAINKLEAGAVPGVTTAVPGVSAERNVQVMVFSSASYLCPVYANSVKLILGEQLGSSPSPTSTS